MVSWNILGSFSFWGGFFFLAHGLIYGSLANGESNQASMRYQVLVGLLLHIDSAMG